jgi:thioredoxin-related protein
MRLILTMTAFLFFPTFVKASDTTIVFRKVKYVNIFELAKNERKPIFLYFHYDGCGACKKMEKTAFVDKKVIEFYNSHLICFEVNTLKGEGIETNKIYQVKLHPTYLFLDEKGNITHKIVGTFSPEEFLRQGQDALISTKTLAYFKQQYDQGKRNPDFLIEYCYKLRDAWELDSLKINEYLKTQTVNDYRKGKNIKFIYEFAIYQGTKCIPFESPGYNFMSLNKELFTPYFDLEQVNTRLMFLILDAVYNAIERKEKHTFDKAIDALKQYDIGKEYNFKEIDGRTTMWTTSKSLVLSAEMAFYKKIGDSNKNLE